MRASLLLFLRVFCAVLCLVSCSEIRQPVLTATANSTEIGPGKTAQIVVTRQYPGGGPIETVTKSVRYTATSRDILDVSDTGLVTPGNESGTADVRIEDLDTAATASIRFTVSAARIVALRMDPSSPIVLKPGESRQFGAIATLSDGTESNVTTRVVWDSSHAAAASVGRTQGDVGNVLGVARGETTITATDAATNIQARTVVIVEGDPATLAAITISPNPATVAVGAVVPLTAIGIYTDGKTEDVTHSATWSTTDASRATVDANGVVTGVSAGFVAITAAEKSGLTKGSTALTIQ